MIVSDTKPPSKLFQCTHKFYFEWFNKMVCVEQSKKKINGLLCFWMYIETFEYIEAFKQK